MAGGAPGAALRPRPPPDVSYVKTAVLLSGLIGLFIAVGHIVGGQQGHDPGVRRRAGSWPSSPISAVTRWC